MLLFICGDSSNNFDPDTLEALLFNFSGKEGLEILLYKCPNQEPLLGVSKAMLLSGDAVLLGKWELCQPS